MKIILSLTLALVLANSAGAVVREPGTILDVACGTNILESSGPDFVTKVCIAGSHDAQFVATHYVRVVTMSRSVLYRLENVRGESSFLDVIEQLETWQLVNEQGQPVQFSVTLGDNGLPTSIRGQMEDGLSFDAQNFKIMYHIQLIQ